MKVHDALMQDVRAAQVPYGSVAFWWLGQMGFLIKLGDAVISVDAYLDGSNATRLRKPMLAPEEYAGVDAVVGTHDHEDHIDRAVWGEIAKACGDVTFVLPMAHTASVSKDLDIPESRMRGLTEGTSCEVAGVRFTGIAAAHELREYDDAGNSLHMSYIIEGNGVRLFHAGDSCVYEGYESRIKSFGPIDIMFLPINGRDAARLRRGCIGNMTYQEAADLAGAVAPGLTVPAHYDMFPGNLANPFDFSDYLEEKYPQRRCWVGAHGEAVTYRREA